MKPLSEERCVPCHGGVPPLQDDEIRSLLAEIPDWQVLEVQGEKRLQRTYKVRDFNEALEFTNRIGEIAEKEDHHPLIITEWGRVTVAWWTHAIHGLHRNDFIMAAKTDRLYQEFSDTSAPA